MTLLINSRVGAVRPTGSDMGQFWGYQQGIFTDSTRMPRDRDLYIDSIGVRSIYYIDIIEMDNPVVLHKKFTDRYFIFPEHTDLSKLDYTDIMNNSNAYILEFETQAFELGMATWDECKADYYWPGNRYCMQASLMKETRQLPYNENFELCSFENGNPDWFLLLLIPFCNENAYYRLLIPLYKSEKCK